MRQAISVGLTTLMSLTSSWPARRPARKSGLLIRSSVYLTSSAVNGSPSCHFTSLRSLMRQLRPSCEMPPLATVGTSAASSGTKTALGGDAPERAEDVEVDALIHLDMEHQRVEDGGLLRDADHDLARGLGGGFAPRPAPAPGRGGPARRPPPSGRARAGRGATAGAAGRWPCPGPRIVEAAGHVCLPHLV